MFEEEKVPDAADHQITSVRGLLEISVERERVIVVTPPEGLLE